MRSLLSDNYSVVIANCSVDKNESARHHDAMNKPVDGLRFVCFVVGLGMKTSRRDHFIQRELG